MADGVCQSPASVRRTFLIEAHRHSDVVLRVLGLFAVQDAEVLMIEAAQGAQLTSIRIETGGLAEGAAQHLVERLRAMPAVTGVGLGWRAMA